MAPSEAITAVLDTSALWGIENRRSLVEAALANHFIGIWSPHIIGELNRALTIRWIEKQGTGNDSQRRLSRNAKRMMTILLATFQLVDTSPNDEAEEAFCSDLDDSHLLTAARRSNATHVVSQNTNDFPPADADGYHVYDGVVWLTPEKFFSDLAQ